MKNSEQISDIKEVKRKSNVKKNILLYKTFTSWKELPYIKKKKRYEKKSHAYIYIYSIFENKGLY